MHVLNKSFERLAWRPVIAIFSLAAKVVDSCLADFHRPLREHGIQSENRGLGPGRRHIELIQRAEPARKNQATPFAMVLSSSLFLSLSEVPSRSLQAHLSLEMRPSMDYVVPLEFTRQRTSQALQPGLGVSQSGWPN